MEALVQARAPAVSDGILDHIGDTPLVRLPPGFAPGVDCELLLKLEFLNPGGSVKDRIGWNMIRAAERSGALPPGGTVVEATSGNTGVGLAMVAAARGYACIMVMPDRVSREKVDLLKAFGARVVLTASGAGPDEREHFVPTAARIAAAMPGAWLADQFGNPANPQAHFEGTGPEIWEQTGGRLDVLVGGCGTGGTLHGTARFLKARQPALRVVAVDPTGSVYARYWREGVAGKVAPHAVEGVGQDRIPATWNPGLIDAYEVVADREAFALCRRLARETGIFAGGSSGLALAGALREGRRLPADSRVVVILPDSGARYLSKCFNDDWLRDAGFLPGPEAAAARVRDLLREGPRATVRLEDDLAAARKQLGERGVRPLPVVDASGGLAGVVDEVRLLELAARGGLERRRVAEALAPPPPVLAPADPWRRAVTLLRVHEAILVREEAGWAGLDRAGLLQTLQRLRH